MQISHLEKQKKEKEDNLKRMKEKKARKEKKKDVHKPTKRKKEKMGEKTRKIKNKKMKGQKKNYKEFWNRRKKRKKKKQENKGKESFTVFIIPCLKEKIKTKHLHIFSRDILLSSYYYYYYYYYYYFPFLFLTSDLPTLSTWHSPLDAKESQDGKHPNLSLNPIIKIQFLLPWFFKFHISKINNFEHLEFVCLDKKKPAIFAVLRDKKE